MSNYPTFSINGRRLSGSQSMTLYVALQAFLIDMQAKGVLGNDEHGEAMRDIYRRNASEINQIIFTT